MVGDVRAYRDTIAGLNNRIEAGYRALAEKLQSDGAITKDERDRLLRERVLATAELNFIGGALDEFANSVSWANIDARGYSSTKGDLERSLVLNENVHLRRRNTDLERQVGNMVELQSGLTDKVIALADGKIGDIERTLTRIDSVLASINLKDRQALVRKVANERSDGIGGKYIPLQGIDLSDAELDKKFKDAKSRVNLWEGLSLARTMLPLGYPVKTDQRITSHFGERTDPFLGTPAMHTGIDFGGHHGAPLYSTGPGKIVYSGNRGDYGLTVEVNHGMGFSTLYAHLSRIDVGVGDMVEAGTKVGLAGSTGRSTATHLHYEVRYNGRPLNPYAMIKVER